MKKFLRMVVVFALAAGASLAYTSCTKDYDKELQDVNTELSALQSTVSGLQTAISNLEALASTVSSQGGDISGIKATISQLQSAINAIQSNMVTKEEAEQIAKNAVRSLKEELDEIKADYVSQEDLFDILSELTNGMLDMMTLLEMQVVGGVKSISKIPAGIWGGVDDMDGDWIEAYNLTAGGLGVTEIVPTTAIFQAAFNVTPAESAEELAENAFAYLRVYSPWTELDTYVPAEIVDYNEAGDIYVKADLTNVYNLYMSVPAIVAALPNADTYASLTLLDEVIIPSEDDDEEDVTLPVTNISTPFFALWTPAGPTDIFGRFFLYNEDEYAFPVLAGALNNIEVPYNQFETSARTFGDGLEILINGNYTIDEFAETFNIDPALLTPTVTITQATPFTGTAAPARATAAPNFNYNADSAEISMKATSLNAAKAQIDNYADVNIDLMFGNAVSNAFTQRYIVVEADGGKAVIEGESFVWKGRGSNVVNPANDVRTEAKVDAEALVTPDNIKVPAAGFNYAAGDGPALGGLPQPIVPVPVAYLANEHVNLATVNYPVGAFRHTAANRNVKLSHDYVDANFVKTVYEMSVAIGPKPANRNIDLGTFTAMGSSSNNVTVKLGGIIQKIIDMDAALYGNVPVGAGATLISRFIDDATWATVTVLDENGVAVAVPADFTTNLAKTAQNGDDSNLVITNDVNNYTMYGNKFTVTGTIAIWGVTYTVSYKVALDDAAFRLVTTPYVQEGNIIPVEGTIVGGTTYKLDDIHMSKYFQIDSELPINDALTVDFTFDYEWDGKTPNVRYAPTGAISVPAKPIIGMPGIGVTPATGLLVDAPASTLQWNTYDGRKIYGVAQLKAAGVNIGAPIEFTLVTPNPIVSATAKDVTLDRFSGVDSATIIPDANIDIVTVLTAKRAYDTPPTSTILAPAGYPQYAITIGAFDPATGFAPFAATNWPTLQGTLNGAAFTFTNGVHYTVSGTGSIVFLADNAAGDIEVDVPICIQHVLDYEHGIYNGGLYGLTEGVEIVKLHIKLIQR